jgi:hypothetical protein
MLVHRLLVERVDCRRLSGSAGGNDVLGDNFDGSPFVPGEKELGPLRRKGARNSTADRASGSVDHYNLVLQHHLWFLSVPGCHTRPLFTAHLLGGPGCRPTAVGHPSLFGTPALSDAG